MHVHKKIVKNLDNLFEGKEGEEEEE